MAVATIYHNPRCSKSRQALALLREAGIEPEIVDYQKTPLDAVALTALFERIGLNDIRDAMRKGEAAYRELGLADASNSRDDLIAAIVAHPILLERPIVVGSKGAAVCRPPERALELIKA